MSNAAALNGEDFNPMTEGLRDGQRLSLDVTRLGVWDSYLMIALIDVMRRCHDRHIGVDTSGLPKGMVALLELSSRVPERTDAIKGVAHRAWLERLGESARSVWLDGFFLTQFIGESATSMVALITGRARFRPIDLWLQIQACGPSALPIVTLISLLVGLILAFVGAVQLALFGAELYMADLVSLGMTREMGALMTAIIMAGRSGAAFAAQMGTMNVNLEISALRVMGFTASDFLVLPRMLALILVMPFLGLYADLMGIIGGGIVAISFFDIPLTQFIQRTSESVHLTDFFIGLFKCSLFGVLIALAGCFRGIQCGRSASAVGEAATSAVVTSIVFIVVADSVVTLICHRLGI
ncbi:MAG: ABC transporter permease [Methylococcus sp.]|jgi:phospholipid/cholesterol/gamma-HCH transport system permease protein